MQGLQLAELIFKERGLPMLQADSLDFEYPGVLACKQTEQAAGRRGVLETGNFYFGLIGCPGVPQKETEWFYAPETAYACAVNGRIFYGEESEFGKIRKELQKGYPEDVRIKKIAARAVTMAQAGQYNYERSRKRKDGVAAYVALSEFIKASCSMLHLLNHRYMPFYKWAWRSACALPVLSETAKKLEKLLPESQTGREWTERRGKPTPGTQEENVSCSNRTDWMEEICFDVKEELKRQNLTGSDSVFLEPHGKEIMCRIENEQIRSLPVLFG